MKSDKNDSHCCEAMSEQVNFACETHSNNFDCPDALLAFNPALCEYGIIVHDGGTSVIRISFCPWCGTKLPESRRDEWFDELAKLGINDPWEKDIPEAFRSDKWYKNTTAAKEAYDALMKNDNSKS